MSMENATLTLPYNDYEEMKKRVVELEHQLVALQAKDRAAALEATPHAVEYVNGLLGARICIGFAISKLGAAFTAGWPVEQLRAFVKGLSFVDSGDPDVAQSVKDFEIFATEVDEAESIRRERKKNPPKSEPVAEASPGALDRGARLVAEQAEALRRQLQAAGAPTFVETPKYVEELPHLKE